MSVGYVGEHGEYPRYGCCGNLGTRSMCCGNLVCEQRWKGWDLPDVCDVCGWVQHDPCRRCGRKLIRFRHGPNSDRHAEGEVTVEGHTCPERSVFSSLRILAGMYRKYFFGTRPSKYPVIFTSEGSFKTPGISARKFRKLPGPPEHRRDEWRYLRRRLRRR